MIVPPQTQHVLYNRSRNPLRFTSWIQSALLIVHIRRRDRPVQGFSLTTGG